MHHKFRPPNTRWLWRLQYRANISAIFYHFFFLSENNRIWHFMQIVSTKFHQFVVCCICPEWNIYIYIYGGCSKWIAYFYLETSNFKLAQKYSFHALEVLPVARNAKFLPMYPLLEGVTVRWFGHSNKVLMNGRSKCLSGLVFPPSKECFQFRKQKEITWGKVWGIRGLRQNSYFFFLQKRRNYCGDMSWGIVM